MDIIQLVVAGMVLTILATITLAAVSYGAFKMRQSRNVPDDLEEPAVGPVFFERVRIPVEPSSEEGDAAA